MSTFADPLQCFFDADALIGFAAYILKSQQRDVWFLLSPLYTLRAATEDYLYIGFKSADYFHNSLRKIVGKLFSSQCPRAQLITQNSSFSIVN